MKFLKRHRKKSAKLVLLISDLHLSAGASVKGKRNNLEDFHSDQELEDFLSFYSSTQNTAQEVELIINGDFLDFLAVPFVEYYEDEFWSEKATVDKLEMIYQAHVSVFEALDEFAQNQNFKITYIIGNHDAELILPAVRDKFLSYFSEDAQLNIEIMEASVEYSPLPGVCVKHGHEYEFAHHFDKASSIIESNKGERYFLPPWGSYYVIQVINKFKQERIYINQIRPIKHFLIYGILFDTLFTLRFILANIYYFFMVRIWLLFKTRKSLSKLWKQLSEELSLFQNYEDLTQDFFDQNPQYKALIVGHTHEPIYRLNQDGCVFINSGTWTNMTNLDFAHLRSGRKLTFVMIQALKTDFDISEFEQNVDLDLFEWRGKSLLPYEEYV